MKRSTSYYATSVENRELERTYFALYAIPGESSRWVMEGAERKLFTQPEAAELAAFRSLAALLNRACRPQEAVVIAPRKQIRSFQASGVGKDKGGFRTNLEAEHVFSRFKKADS